jgi:malonate transporter and related proteins
MLASLLIVLPSSASSGWELVDSIAGAAVPCSLVAMGIALRRYGLQARLALPGLISALNC